jgi:hypothetical protein
MILTKKTMLCSAGPILIVLFLFFALGSLFYLVEAQETKNKAIKERLRPAAEAWCDEACSDQPYRLSSNKYQKSWNCWCVHPLGYLENPERTQGKRNENL